jgi:hypothetical protein
MLGSEPLLECIEGIFDGETCNSRFEKRRFDGVEVRILRGYSSVTK